MAASMQRSARLASGSVTSASRASVHLPVRGSVMMKAASEMWLPGGWAGPQMKGPHSLDLCLTGGKRQKAIQR